MAEGTTDKEDIADSIYKRADKKLRINELSRARSYYKRQESENYYTEEQSTLTEVVQGIATSVVPVPESPQSTSLPALCFKHDIQENVYYRDRRRVGRYGVVAHTMGPLQATTSLWGLQAAANVTGISITARLALATITADVIPLKLSVQMHTALEVNLGWNPGQESTPANLAANSGMVNRESGLTRTLGAHVLNINRGYRTTFNFVPRGGPTWFFGPTSSWYVGNRTDVCYQEKRVMNFTEKSVVVNGSQAMYLGPALRLYDHSYEVVGRDYMQTWGYKKEQILNLKELNQRREQVIQDSMQSLKTAVIKTGMATFEQDTTFARVKNEIQDRGTLTQNVKAYSCSAKYAIWG